MGKTALTVQETQAMFLHVSAGMVSSKNLLTEADKAIGDGDHGVGMARGFDTVRQKLEGQIFSTLDGLFDAIGLALMTSVGGAAGAIFGTFFRGGAENLGGRQTFNSGALSTWLVDGLDAVQKRGGAKSGDKTMVDALGPAARRSEVLVSAPLNESLVLVAEAAQQGMEDTKAMIPALGKARPLGERALGHRDPGAVSTYLLLKYMAEYVAEKEK